MVDCEKAFGSRCSKGRFCFCVSFFSTGGSFYTYREKFSNKRSEYFFNNTFLYSAFFWMVVLTNQKGNLSTTHPECVGRSS